MRDRETAASPRAVKRVDPKAIAESIGGALERINQIEKNFDITWGASRTYDDGSSKYDSGVTITVQKGGNRTFRVSAREAEAGKDQVELTLIGDVRLEDSDGFVLTTDRGTFHQKDLIASAPGKVAFSKGRMSGSGVGIRYDQQHDLLIISAEAQVRTTDEAGNPAMEFTAGNATLDRVNHRLTLDTNAHVVRGEQVIEADHAEASLSDDDQIVRFVALRGNSRVEGGGSSIDAMSARDIDLDYTDDGARLEAVALNGGAAVAMKGESGGGQRQIIADVIDLKLAEDESSRMVLTGKASVVTPGEGGGSGRTIAADALEIDLAPDGSLTRVIGRDNVRLDLPAAQGAPVRSIRTKLLDGRGAAGKGLTAATFTGEVTFTEQAGKAGARREVRAQKLETAMNGDAVAMANFTGDVTFEETGLKACAGRLDYQPDKGMMALSIATAAGLPTVADEQVNIEAQTIDVTLEMRAITGKGMVTTRMGSGTRCRPTTERTAAERGQTRMPGLLDPKTAVTVRAGSLTYAGASGKAVYAGPGRALLTQNNTAIHADTIALDQSKGDLTATGNASANIPLDGGDALGKAHEIRYTDATRLITYAVPPAGYKAPAAPPGAAAAAREPQLQMPQGRITAGSRIELRLATEGAKLERLEARTNVTMLQQIAGGSRTASGGERLQYDPVQKKFDMTAGGTTLVKIVDRSSPSSCREFTGRSLTFYESGDQIIIDGQEKNRTQTAPSACAAPR